METAFDKIHKKMSDFARGSELTKRYKDIEPEVLDFCFDNLVPRGEIFPPNIFITKEEFLSRLAMLRRKIRGVEYRKKQWDKIVEDHLNLFGVLVDAWGRAEESLDAESKKHVKLSFGYTDIQAENEFEMLIHSIYSTLELLTKVVASFIQGKTEAHTHSKLLKLLEGKKEWENLSEICSTAIEDWIDDLRGRRTAAAHYVALTASSQWEKEGKNSLPKSIYIAITKKPVQKVPIWIDDVPIIGIPRTLSVKSDDGREAHEIYNGKGLLILRSTSKLLTMPETIDGVAYVNSVFEKFNNYLVASLSELGDRVNTCGINS